MKSRYLLTALSATSLLVAGCNSGSTSSGTEPAQASSVTTENGVAITYNATNCRTISPNGTCSVVLTYIASQSQTVGQAIGFAANDQSGVPTPGVPAGYSSTISSCPTISTTLQTCQVTITASSTANTKTAQSIYILENNKLIDIGFGVPFGFVVGDSGN